MSEIPINLNPAGSRSDGRSPGAARLKEKISIKSLRFNYGTTEVLKGLSLPIYEKCVTAFIGPSGCGKSTLLRVINRMFDLYPSQKADGEVLLDGGNILDPKHDVDHLRAKVGMVFQKPTPFPMSIFENVAFGIRLHERLTKRALDERVEQALRDAALWDEVKSSLDKSALGLSGGQQQRLCIARAIAIRPSVLLLDEPASALDPISTAKVEELITVLSNDYTIVIVTHNMQQAARISDFTAFLLLGDLVEFGPTERIFTNPIDRRTEAYVTGRFG